MDASRPLRIGLASSSGDQPELIPLKSWFPVLGMTVSKYVKCYAHLMPEIRDYNFRISYRNIEYTNNISKIEHPFIRESLIANYPDIKSLNISCLSTLPSGLGLGSSGAFAVAFTDLISRLEEGKKLSSYELFINAYNTEKRICNKIGFQDHLHASYGGFNLYEIRFSNIEDRINFRPEVRVRPLRLKRDSIEKINETFSLLYVPYSSVKYRDGKLGSNIRKESWKIQELEDRYENLYNLINLIEADTINLEEIGNIISEDSIKKQKAGGFDEVTNTLNELRSKSLIYGGRPLGSKGSKFAIIVSNKKNLKTLSEKGYKTIPIEMEIKN